MDPKWTIVGVPKAALASGRAMVGRCAISVTTMDCNPISAPAAEPMPETTSYRDLLDPVANPMPLLKADNARLAQSPGSQGTR
ncbi:MAG: hypothetical protein WAK55_07290, partial [Xanthobacteraceae bacterium]